MPVPPLKGVVFDVDGTLLTRNHRVSKHMQATCRALVDKGVWLSIASARPPGSVRQIGEAIGATGPLCALNGAIILGQDGVIQQRISLPQRTALELIARFTRDSRVSLNLYLRIPIYSGRVFRREAGRGSEVKPATIPS
jgi:hydroxymethylpyrimidine pyrophosphatase-like HAD family hydrolase